MKYQTGQRDGLLMDSAKDLIVIEERPHPSTISFGHVTDVVADSHLLTKKSFSLSLQRRRRRRRRERDGERQRERERERDGREWQTWNMESTLCSSSSFLRITLSQRLAQEKDRDAEKETS